MDVTQPDLLVQGLETTTATGADRLANIPAPLGGSTGFVPSCWDGDPSGGCGVLPYPSMLWEFTDPDTDPLFRSKDRNNLADLGDTWSAPTIPAA